MPPKKKTCRVTSLPTHQSTRTRGQNKPSTNSSKSVEKTNLSVVDEEEEDVRPMLRIKPSSGFKKIAKWMHSPELVAEEYVL